MKQAILWSILLTCCGCLVFSQSADTAKFEIADVHTSAKVSNPFVRTNQARGRYEMKFATMVDLVRTAYDFDADKVVGGPNWLEMDRFDILAKLPPDSTTETQKLMLQSLLADRFKLVVHKETKPLPAYAITVGKKLQLKEADGSGGENGCKPQTASGPAPEGGIRLMMASATGGGTTTFNLGPGMSIQFICRNMTMAAFAAGLRNMMGAGLGPNAVSDETGLKGMWNFDVRWSMQLSGPMITNNGDRITVADALDKQLGLKLEERQVPTPVIVVDSVNRTPSPNPAGLAEALPPVPAPTEFEVASVKPTDPGSRMSRFQMLAGGRFNAEGMSLRTLVGRAFATNNMMNNSEQVTGLPAFADSERFDIVAKAPSGAASMGPMDMEATAPMIRALLVDRFKMTYHREDRPVTAYSLVAAKPKMKKADPASRTSCKYPNTPTGAPPGSRVLVCQNIAMAQFADRLQNMTSELSWPVLDATGIEGGWDFTLTYSQNFAVMAFAARGGGGDAGQPGAAGPSASDPSGGYTLFEAVEKQLGLKLEAQKRPMPVIVIDHIEQKPTDN